MKKMSKIAFLLINLLVLFISVGLLIAPSILCIYFGWQWLLLYIIHIIILIIIAISCYRAKEISDE